MKGWVRLSCAAALVSCLAATASLAAPANGAQDQQPAPKVGQRVAQSGYERMAIPKPSERRAGELENWTGDDKKATPARSGQKAAASGPKSKAAAAKPSRGERSGDGGLPLPSSRDNSDMGAPVGFDKNGNLGTGFKF
jgi:hypothetical protein